MQSLDINPFYAARLKRVVPSPQGPSRTPVYARLPLAPVNASPVPHLTSLYHFIISTGLVSMATGNGPATVAAT